MKKTIILITILCFISINTSAQEWQWADEISGNNNTVTSSVATDANGFIYLSGYFKDDLNIGDTTLTAVGENDAFFTCFDMNGELQWIKHISGSGDEYAMNIKAFDGSIYLSGMIAGGTSFGNDTIISSGGLFVSKHNLQGEMQWITLGGSTSDYCNDMAVSNNGDVFIAGTLNSNSSNFGSYTLIRNGFSDAMMIKYSSEGNIAWAYNFKGSQYEYGSAIAVSDDKVYIGARYSSEITVNDTTITPYDGADIFVACFSQDLSFNWIRSAGGTDNEEINDLVVDKTNNIWVTGWYMGTITFDEYFAGSYGEYDVFLARYDENGDIAGWTHTGSAYSDEGRSLAVLNDNTIALAGTFMSSINLGIAILESNGESDGFYTRITQDFSFIEAAQIGGAGEMSVKDVSALNDYSIAITGNFYEDITFGNYQFNNPGALNSYIAKLEILTGTEERNIIGNSNISVFPNPATESFIISIDGTIPEYLYLTDILGYRIARIETNGNKTIKWNCSGNDYKKLSPGTYFIFPADRKNSNGAKIQIIR